MNNEFDIKVNVVEGKNDLQKLKGEFDSTTQSAKETGKAVDEVMNKVSKGEKLPLTDSMKELLTSAQEAQRALTHMVENGGTKVLSSHLMRASELLDEIRKKSKLGEALGVGKNYDMSGFKEVSSFASKMGSVISTLNQEEKAHADLVSKLAKQKEQAELASQRGVVQGAKQAAAEKTAAEKEMARQVAEAEKMVNAEANELARVRAANEKEMLRQVAEAAQMQADAEKKAKKDAAETTIRLAREKAEAEKRAAADAMANSRFAGMGRDAYSQYQSDGNLEAYKANLQQIIALRDASASRASLPEFVKTGDLNAQLDAVRNLARGADEASKALNGLKQSTDSASSSAKHSNGIFSNFGGSLIRIAKLRLLRGIVRSITSAFKEGTQNIYQYSTALGSADASNFKNTMDGLASSLLKMKNAIGTAIAPLLSAIVPILQKIVGWVTAAIDALAQFFAVLNGQKTYTRVKDVSVAWQDTADNISGATDAAQEYKNTILGFDEINALDSPNQGGGGSGGGGGSSVSPSDMFEEAPVATTGLQGVINGIAKFIKPAVDMFKAIPDGLDIALTMAQALLEGSPKKFEEGLKKIQQLFKKNNTFKDVVTWAFNAATDVQKFFEQLWTKLRLGVAKVARDIIKYLEPALKLIGIDPKKTLQDLDKTIEDLSNEVEWNEDKVKTAKKAWEDFANSKISPAGWTIVQQAVSGAFGKAKGTAEAFFQTIKTMEKYKFDPKLLYLGMDKAKTASERAKIGVENLKKMVKFLESQGIDTSKIRKELEKMEGSADKTKDAVKGVQKADDNLQNSGFSLKGKRNELQGTASMSDSTKKAMDRTRGALNLLQVFGFSMNGKVQQLQNVMNAGKDASGKVDGVKSSLSSLSDYKPTGFGIFDFFANIGKWITDTWNTLKGFVGDLIKIPKTDYTKYYNPDDDSNSRRKTNQKKDGGFITRSMGGFIPRFDGGGINSADIFLANENGNPELVGRIGNRTAVANQGQMVEAMSQGIYRAMSELMQGNGTSEVNVYMDGQRIAHVVDRANRQKNRRMNVRLV